VVSLAKTPFGFFAIAMQNQIVEMKELPRDPKKVAEILIGDEFKKWKDSLKIKGLDIDSEDFDPMRAVELIGIKKKEYLDFARLVQIEMSKVDIKKFIGRDYLILQAVSGLDDLNKSINIVVNRIREWYGLHYPELKIEDHEKYLKKIIEEKSRGESMGVEFSGKDLDAIKKQSEMVLQMYKAREGLEVYLEKLMEEVAPNVKNIAGANLGARLIERAGSLGGLAKLPASTIQVLGAEKALFKHLQKGTPSPKHGVIFQHPVINRAPLNKRGKLARTLGTKIALSAKADFYAGELRPSIMADWDKRVKEVLK
jgi:nucleolar protein 56